MSVAPASAADGSWRQLLLINVTKENSSRARALIFWGSGRLPERVYVWIVPNDNQRAQHHLSSPGSCYLSLHCKGLVDLYGDTESKGENSKGEIPLKKRFQLSGRERREGKKRKEEGSDCWSLHRYFLGASIVSQAVKAGRAGFPSCRLNPRLGAVVLDRSQQPDRSVLQNREKPFHVQPLAVSVRFTIPRDWQQGKEKGVSFSPLYLEPSTRPPGESFRPVALDRTQNWHGDVQMSQ